MERLTNILGLTLNFRKMVAALAAMALMLFIIAATLIVSFNRLQPSHQEMEFARPSVEQIKINQSLGTPQEIFFEARRGMVNINAYGISRAKEDMLIEFITSLVREVDPDFSVILNYFPTREVKQLTNNNGATVTEVNRGIPSRIIVIKEK